MSALQELDEHVAEVPRVDEVRIAVPAFNHVRTRRLGGRAAGVNAWHPDGEVMNSLARCLQAVPEGPARLALAAWLVLGERLADFNFLAVSAELEYGAPIAGLRAAFYQSGLAENSCEGPHRRVEVTYHDYHVVDAKHAHGRRR